MKQKRSIHFLSMLIGMMLLLLLQMLVGMMISMQQAEESLKEMLTERAEHNREQQAKVMTNLFLTSRNILGNFMYDDDVYRILKTPGSATLQNIRTIRSKLRMSQTMYLDDISYRVILIDLNGNIYTSIFNTLGLYDEIMGRQEIKDAIRDRTSYSYLRHPLWYGNDEDPHAKVDTFSIVNIIMDQYGSKNIGLLLLSISEQSILSSFEKDGPVMAVHGSNQDYLFGSMNEEMYEYIRSSLLFSDSGLADLNWQGQQYLISRSFVKNGDIFLYQAITYDAVYAELIRMQKTNITVIIVIFLVMVFILMAVIIIITTPLNKLYKQICNVNITREGTIPFIRAEGFREFADIANAINDMSARTMTMFQTINQQRQEQEELNYRYLLSQLDPHFLLNTLNNIKWSAYMCNARHAAEMITALGFILETSLGKQQGEVTVSYEVEHVKNYMLLQEMHFGDEVTYDLSVADEVRNIPIERFILQTLVGNSIKHGYVKGRQMHIEIKIYQDETALYFIVRDNGKGIPHQQLNQICEDLKNRAFGEKSAHIGLRNLNQRLLFRYGENARIDVKSDESAGTCITLTILLKALTGESECTNC